MELILRFSWFELCLRTRKMYSPACDKVLPAALNVRMGNMVWTTGKGFYRLETT